MKYGLYRVIRGTLVMRASSNNMNWLESLIKDDKEIVGVTDTYAKKKGWK